MADIDRALWDDQWRKGYDAGKEWARPKGDWEPIATAPRDKWLLLWWIPVDGNPHAEACIIGQVSSHRPGKYWDGKYKDELGEEGYKDLARITHWMWLPAGPALRRSAES